MSAPQKHILVVEDSVELRDAVRIMLVHAGYRVSTAGDGARALELLAAGTVPDALLVDVLMPGMDGAELLSRLRSQPRLADVPIGVMTGIATGLVSKLLKTDVLLTKPFTETELLQAVRQLLRTAR